MAPPTAVAVSFSLVAHFARSPFSATSKPPSTQRSMWPPRIMAKLSACPTKEAPGTSVIGCLPALMSQGSSRPFSGAGPMPITPFSDWKTTSRSGGTWFATRVGMPMPRLTHQPSGMSSAARRAIWSRLKGCIVAHTPLAGIPMPAASPRPGRAAVHPHHPFHVDPGGVDPVRADLAQLPDVLHLRDRQVRSRRHHRVEVPAGSPVGEVAPAVRLPRLHQRHVALQGALHDVAAAVELAHLLAPLQQGAGGRGGV